MDRINRTGVKGSHKKVANKRAKKKKGVEEDCFRGSIFKPNLLFNKNY